MDGDSQEFAALFNHAEAFLWWSMAVFFVVRFTKSRALWRCWNWVLPLAFGFFGVSDWIEARTGAWWTPWWLLAIKAACVAVFLAAYVRMRKKTGSVKGARFQKEK